MAWTNSTKRAASVVGAGVVGGTAGVGAVYCTEQFLPSQMTHVKKYLAEHVVLPHIEMFDNLAKGLRTAHENYDKRKREQLVESGQALPADVTMPTTPMEHAYDIADVLVKASVGLASDFTATLGLQTLFDKLAHVKGSSPAKTIISDAAVTLGSIIAMPTLFAKTSENIHNGLRHKLRSIAGMSNEKADDIALPITYVSIPNLLGLGAALAGNHAMGRGK